MLLSLPANLPTLPANLPTLPANPRLAARRSCVPMGLIGVILSIPPVSAGTEWP